MKTAIYIICFSSLLLSASSFKNYNTQLEFDFELKTDTINSNILKIDIKIFNLNEKSLYFIKTIDGRELPANPNILISALNSISDPQIDPWHEIELIKVDKGDCMSYSVLKDLTLTNSISEIKIYAEYIDLDSITNKKVERRFIKNMKHGKYFIPIKYFESQSQANVIKKIF